VLVCGAGFITVLVCGAGFILPAGINGRINSTLAWPVVHVARFLLQPKKNPAEAGFPVYSNRMKSGSGNVGCLQTFRTLLDIKVYALSFSQCLESVSTNRRKVHEYIFAAIVRRDKSKTLGIVEPFNSACGHVVYLYKKLNR
jgi:hypothetical protein